MISSDVTYGGTMIVFAFHQHPTLVECDSQKKRIGNEIEINPRFSIQFLFLGG